MRNEILAWYAYSESGAAGVATLEREPTTTPGATHPGLDFGETSADFSSFPVEEEPGDEVPGVDEASRLSQHRFDASRVANLFADARKLDAEVDASAWKHLFSRYGLEGLIDLARSRRAGWPEKTSDETVAEAIVSDSLDAGYDPVSGLIGTFEKRSRRFEPQRRMGVPPMQTQEDQEQEHGQQA